MYIISPSLEPPKLVVKDIANVQVSVPVPGKKVTVLLFVGTECPVSNRLAPEISRIVSKYTPKSVSFVYVYPDVQVKPEAVRKHGKDYGLGGTAVIDKDRVLVKQFKPTVTPEAAVILPSGDLVYRGRINNLYTDHNQTKETSNKNELREVLDQVLAGKKVTVKFMSAIGCAITSQ